MRGWSLRHDLYELVVKISQPTKKKMVEAASARELCGVCDLYEPLKKE